MRNTLGRNGTVCSSPWTGIVDLVQKNRLTKVLVASLATMAALAPFLPQPAKAASSLNRSSAPTSPDLATGFVEPLVRTAPTSSDEDWDLERAVESYRALHTGDDLRPLEAFLANHPRSGWRVAVLANLGFFYLHYGYFSRTVVVWEDAWREGRNASDPHARALVDRTVGDLARLYAGLGRSKRLAALLDEIGNRPVSGPATESVQIARETLAIMRTDPRHLFRCGPMALKALMLAEGAAPYHVHFLDRYRAGLKGVSLAELAQLADTAHLPYRAVFRKPGEAVPVPSVVHWKVGHFAAILRQAGGRFLVKDPVLGQDGLWIPKAALDAEASGYFLASARDVHSSQWSILTARDAGQVWGAGPTIGPRPGDVSDPLANLCPAQNPNLSESSRLGQAPALGMCAYNIKELTVGLTLLDMPVGYVPPVGPSAQVTLTYNQREDSQPANFSFFNVSPKWTLNWLSYVQDDPNSPGSNVMRFLPDGDAFYYLGFNQNSGVFAPQDDDASILTLVSENPVIYQRTLNDGSTEIYKHADGSASYPRKVFLTQIADSAGNTVTLNYDNRLRLISITDATRRSTKFSYSLTAQPLLVTAITDPFGRRAKLAYDGEGRLISITDVLGLTSRFTYDASSLINSMTTPYGTTQFAYGTSTNSRFLQITDPMGYSEREEWLQPAPVPSSDPPNTVPQGMNINNSLLNYRVNFHWNKHAYVVAGCRPTGGCNYSDAHITNFQHDFNDASYEWSSIENIKNPLENRVWYNYPGQSVPTASGTYDLPSAIGRVLDDGTTQLTQLQYNAAGKLTEFIDPVGRQTSLTYDANQIDVAAITQTSLGGPLAIAQFMYNSQHRPLTYTDPAGQKTNYAYNGAGQLTSLTDPLGETTTYNYNSTGELTSIINANGKTAALFTYDEFDRVATYTDSEGWRVSYDYDPADRLIQATYPDGTNDQYTYSKLDLVSYKDRQGHIWSYAYDDDRRLTAITDPLGNKTKYAYYENGTLESLTDPNGHTTLWDIDIQSRPTAKHYADGTETTYTYEFTTSRLNAVTDALGQVKSYQYAPDDRLTGIIYPNPLHATPNVAFGYDQYFPRLLSMSDGTGMTSYTYVPADAPGALQLQQESGPLPNGTITYGYDVLGRVVSRTVGGAPSESFQYDAIGRLIGHADALGKFALTYLGQTDQLTRRNLAGGSVATAWSYQPNTDDRRLKAITNEHAGERQFDFTTTPEDLITGIKEGRSGSPLQNWAYGYDDEYRLRTANSSAGAKYAYTLDPASNITKLSEPSRTTAITYNKVNEITAAGGTPFVYDADGNLLSDGARNYSWDAENRLVGITYAGQVGKKTTFAYDGLDRRVAIGTMAARTTTTAEYLWCGSRICQSQSVTGAINRLYYDEGETIPASQALLYYGPDQLGSVRDVYANSPVFSMVQAYDYDPYGNPTATPTTTPTTDFRYAGMLYQPDSGLYLTQYRAYDPRTARWLSRDPIGFAGGTNTYAYVGANPLSLTDPRGEFYWVFVGGAIGAIVNVGATAIANGGFQNLTSEQILAAAAGGFVSGAVGTIAGPLGGTIALELGTASNGFAAISATGVISAGGSALAQALSNLIDPCHAASLANAAVWGGVGGAVAKLIPTKNLNSLSQSLFFGPESITGFTGSWNAWLNNSGFLTSAGFAAATNFPGIALF